MLTREPYQGGARKLVLAFDVGTTYSGVSYCILDPGEVPQIHSVARYPAQDHVGGHFKIPSILYYDQGHNVRAVGAEALQESVVEKAMDQQWIKLTWWKMHMRPKHLAAAHISDSDIPPLPQELTSTRVLADFMAYLFRCAQTYIEEAHVSGRSLFASSGRKIDFVLSHPNGWEGPQQSQIRQAAVLAGLIPDTPEGQARVRLVTEGEASLHFCISNMLASDSFSRVVIEKPGFDLKASKMTDAGVIIVDAGGGTIDLSAYASTGSPLSFEEIAPTECSYYPLGSVFVTRRASTMIKGYGSRFGATDYVDQMTAAFDQEAKIRFRGVDEPTYVKFGTIRDTELSHNIRNGRLKLQGQDVAQLFRPSIQSTIDAIDKQRVASNSHILFVFLVGGFAMSDYVFSELQAHLSANGLILSRPRSDTGKAVAEGAASFYVDHLVSTRVSRFTYGIDCNTPFDKKNRQHALRRHNMYTQVSGVQVIQNVFSIILHKATRVSETQEYRRSYWMTSVKRTGLLSLNQKILAHRGDAPAPSFTDEDRGALSTACTVYADTSKFARLLQARSGPSSTYYELKFDIVLLFGLTELQAQISWIENVSPVIRIV
ncbi:hypothetical protein CONPUDRAFT_56886 [Coniophora puteana RWD-64-598 SS2]|uniref:Actin-like ATPase domain-containing protein n=1 Tax=Coniophora puteana (strain RWD-64-598) TaxID=741705 RepID=A0A5M3MPU2_CONPW|nr:uncharacterized protein CONPUDRAFT_56886 [Coniophora puteana RWD-64-598 SS2]EIW80581.1 hypothetical protein CONPUDRAFT_56886 [Coniophora puteana RWD-64-598 SS2]